MFEAGDRVFVDDIGRRSWGHTPFGRVLRTEPSAIGRYIYVLFDDRKDPNVEWVGYHHSHVAYESVIDQLARLDR